MTIVQNDKYLSKNPPNAYVVAIHRNELSLAASGYGLTETSAVLTVTPNPDYGATIPSGTVGQPLPGTLMKVGHYPRAHPSLLLASDTMSLVRCPCVT